MSEIDEIKARLDIIDVVQSYTPLARAGRNYKGLCPFHNEKTPSFVVFPETQTWRCFGSCGEGGDVFGFMMKAEGWDFRETLQNLAERAGIELKPRSPQAQAEQENADNLLGLLNSASEFYLKQLLENPKAQIVREYVQHRGLNEETVRAFGIGYAPDEWQASLDYFTQLGYQTKDVLAAGLAVHKEDNDRTYDRFRHRLMIPIRDSRGRTVGFGARALEADQQPKYLNSPQGPLFDKSRLLYGMDMARRHIRESETVVVVEGYMDVIQAHQAGYKNVVAQMGTALTQTQAQQLAKYANRLILALDSDNAGVAATMRGLNVVHESLSGADEDAAQVNFNARGMMSLSGQLKLDTRILQLPEGKDPDEFIRAHSDQWPEVVKQAIPLADYVISVGTRDISPQDSVYDRERAAAQVLPLLFATENDLQRNQNIQRLAMRLHIPEKDLLQLARQNVQSIKPKRQDTRIQHNRQPVQRNGPPEPPSNTSPAAAQASARVKRLGNRALELERYCLSILLKEPLWVFAADRKMRQLALLAEPDEVAIRVLEPFGVKDFTRSDHQELLRLIGRAAEQNKIEPEDFIQQNLTPELADLVEAVLPAPLEAFHKKTSALHRRELQSALKQTNRWSEDTAALDTREFLRLVLEMRLISIERETSELYFLEQDAMYNTAEEGSGIDPLLIRGLTRAKSLIQSAIQDLR